MVIVTHVSTCCVTVGANFAANDSLSSRYTSYLTSALHGLTSPATLLYTDPGCVVTATSHAGTADPLAALQGLARCRSFYEKYLQSQLKIF